MEARRAELVSLPPFHLYLWISGSKVTVFEASGRVGGRVESFRNQQEVWYADLGAMRIPRSHR